MSTPMWGEVSMALRLVAPSLFNLVVLIVAPKRVVIGVAGQ